MKIVFVSNYFNHHQKSVSEYWQNRSEKYRFLSTGKMRDDRKKLGYGELEVPGYVIEYDKTKESEIVKLIEESDVIIHGAITNNTISRIRKSSKVVFQYSERFLKKEDCLWKHIPRALVLWKYKCKYYSEYLLCAGAFVFSDYKKYGIHRSGAFKWGYFPETKYYDIQPLLENKKKRTILWCGRFLNWKHPDDVIEVGRRLKEEGYEFEINFIGAGILRERLEQMATDMGLKEEVHLLGAMKPEQVRRHMEEAGIYLFTSDKQEGWGAVLNEAMNSGCAVIASHAIGSVPYLIENNRNGLIYKSGDIEMLFRKVKQLLDDEKMQESLGKEAYRTITEVWNAEVAVERFMNLAEKIMEGEKYPDLYQEGPCSKAEIIKEDWFYE